MLMAIFGENLLREGRVGRGIIDTNFLLISFNIISMISVMNLLRPGGFLLLFCTRLRRKKSNQFHINLEGNYSFE